MGFFYYVSVNGYIKAGLFITIDYQTAWTMPINQRAWGQRGGLEVAGLSVCLDTVGVYALL